MTGFSDVKSIAHITLELVDQVNGLAVRMCSYGVSEVHTGAGKRIGGMVDGTNLAMGFVAGSRARGGGDSGKQ